MTKTQNKKRKGFTIVELVIVIAVIAILAGVLIPTFGGIIESANRSADTQLVAQINTILVAEGISQGKPIAPANIPEVLKENGITVETKSKNALIVFSESTNSAVLAVIDDSAGTATIISSKAVGDIGQVTVSGDRPVLLGDSNEPAVAADNVGDSNVVALRVTSMGEIAAGFFNITEKSRNGLAQALCEMSAFTDAGTEIVNGVEKIEKIYPTLGAAYKMFMQEATFSTGGAAFTFNENGEKITESDKALYAPSFSTKTTKITEDLVNSLVNFTNIPTTVKLPSFIEKITEEALEIITNGCGFDFVHSSTEIKENDEDSGSIETDKNNHLIYIDNIKSVQVNLQLTCVVKGGTKIADTEETFEANAGSGYMVELPYYACGNTTANKAYKFLGYSFSKTSSAPFSHGLTMISEQERFMAAANGDLPIYAIYEQVDADFKVGNDYYESAGMTYKLSKKGQITSGSTITVISTDAVLDASLIGLANAELTIPSGVELLLPYKSDKTKGSGTAVITKGGSFVEMNFANGAGATQLTIANGVNLVNNGTIHIDACLYYYSTPVQSFIKENQCGVLVVDGAITSTGKINALGAIRGSGTILASGGEVIEVMTIYDWYGGTNAAMAVGITEGAGKLAGVLIDVDGKATSPFNDWKVQNIQVPVTLQSNTKYEVQTVANIDNSAVPLSFTLAGPSDALFVMEQGAEIERATNGENVKLTITKGSVHDTKKTLPLENVVVSGTKATVDFSIIDLPLSHFDVNIAPYADLTISYNNYKVMPGSSITVEKNATLNINTKVVICNSFDLRFNSKSPVDFNESINPTKRVYCTFVPTADAKGVSAKVMQATLQPQKYTVKDLNLDWYTNGTATILNLAIPTTVLESYSERDPAELIVKGTLKFDNDTDASTKAYFAGEITSTKEAIGAIIEVSSAVEACSFNHGYGIKLGDFTVLGKSLSVSEWYTLNVNGLHNATVLAGVNNTAGTLAAGTYKYVTETDNGASVTVWQKQP